MRGGPGVWGAGQRESPRHNHNGVFDFLYSYSCRRLEAAAAAQDGALDSGPAEAVTAAKHNNNEDGGTSENGTASWSGVESVAVEIKLSIRTGWRTVMMMMMVE